MRSSATFRINKEISLKKRAISVLADYLKKNGVTLSKNRLPEYEYVKKPENDEGSPR